MASRKFSGLLLAAIGFGLCVSWSAGSLSAQEPVEETTEPKSAIAEVEVSDIGSAPDQKALDNLKRFLVGSKWQGTFSFKGKSEKLNPEAYEIVRAEREETGDEWLLVAKIKYLDKDVQVPIGLLIKWVDRTPIIVLDQVPIPGMGTFDARVIIRKGMYAGTWAHGEKGGHLFGEITPAETK